MTTWNDSLINKIYKEKEREKSEDRDNLLRLTSHKLYGDKIHYILELIQNAEDEESSQIIFEFDDKGLSVINNGRRFDEEDVWGICSVKPGRKHNKIGFFGLGFKSIFNITKAPQVISYNFNFRIDKYIYPSPLDSIPEGLERYYNPELGAIFHLPYSKELSEASELADSFSLIDDRILLFLENIEELTFIDKNKQEQRQIRKTTDGTHVFLSDTQSEENSTWRVFHQDIKVPKTLLIPEGKEGITETRITIALPLEDKTRETIKNSGVIYCYLPTKQRADLPFLIQADFVPTIARSSITDEEWNLWLMRNLGSFAADVIDDIRMDHSLSSMLYEFIPLAKEIQDEHIKILYEAFKEKLKDKEIAKTQRGWLKPSDCGIPDNDMIRGIINDNDLELIFGSDVSFVDYSLCNKEDFTHAENVLLELSAIKIGKREVVTFLKEKRHEELKDVDWFLDLYDYLRNEFDIHKLREWDDDSKSLFEELKQSHFIFTDEETIVPLQESSRPDRIICYPQSMDLTEVHQLFTEGEIVFLNRYFQESSITHRKEVNTEKEEKRKRVKQWFDAIGVKKYFKQSHIIKSVILPKFVSGRCKDYDDAKIYRLLDYIRMYWPTLESEIRNKRLSASVIDEIKEGLELKTFKYAENRKVESYMSPKDVYFSKRYSPSETMEDLFSGVNDIYFVSPYYLNRERKETRRKIRGRKTTDITWKRFFATLGVWSSPIVSKLSDKRMVSQQDANHDWIEYEDSNWGHQISDDSQSKHIEDLIGYCSGIENEECVKERMLKLWHSLSGNWRLYKDNHCACKYYWHVPHARYLDTKTVHSSSFLELLRTSTWIIGNDGDFHKPPNVFVGSKDNLHLLGGEEIFLIPEAKAGEEFLRDIGVSLEPTVEQVLNHLKQFKNANTVLADNHTKKMSVIYEFLQNKTCCLDETHRDTPMLDTLRREFEENELLYLPRPDKSWWKPSEVFWHDVSEHFSILRGYVEHGGEAIYGVDIKPFLLALGVRERPRLCECLNVLGDFKKENRLDLYRIYGPRVLTYMSQIVEGDVSEDISLEQEVFLCDNNQFASPSSIYYSDNEEYRRYLGKNVQMLWLPFSWINIKDLLEFAGFKRLSHNISVKKNLGSIKEIEGDTISRFTRRISYVQRYLKKKNYHLHDKLQKAGVWQRIRDIDAYEAEVIELDYSFGTDNPQSNCVYSVAQHSFYSRDENRVYISSGSSLFSSHVAKEIAALFEIGKDEAHPILDSFLNTDEDDVDEKLKHYGIDVSEDDESDDQKEVELLSKGEEDDTDYETEGKSSSPKGQSTPQLPKQPKTSKGCGLINPDEFDFNEIKENVPYKKTDGVPSKPSKTIKLRQGHGGNKTTGGTRGTRAHRADAEGIALDLVMYFERLEGKEPEDRHDQRGIGYDIYSMRNESEFFIEVKHFRGKAGTWELTPHEWEKAKTEMDKYFVYVVSRLKEGDTPVIEIVQNPVKYLEPDPPVKKGFSDWKHGVIKVVSTVKLDSE